LLDDYVAQLSQIPDVYGARMIGGGWGGAVLALAEPGTRLEGGLNVISDDALSRIED
jgi:galactokinase